VYPLLVKWELSTKTLIIIPFDGFVSLFFLKKHIPETSPLCRERIARMVSHINYLAGDQS